MAAFATLAAITGSPLGDFVVAAGALAALPVFAFAMLGAIHRPFRPSMLWLAGSVIVYAATCPLAWYTTRLGSERYYVRLAQRLDPVADAVAQFEVDQSRLPGSLNELVPDYVDRIPAPLNGSRRYTVFDAEGLYTTAYWYDLGSHAGYGIVGACAYPYGEADRAILIFTTDGEGKIANVHTDRMPLLTEGSEFDAAAWRANDERMKMAGHLASEVSFVGRTLEDVTELLGEQDGVRDLKASRWELIADADGFVTEFVYRPQQDYPAWLRRFGRWAILPD